MNILRWIIRRVIYFIVIIFVILYFSLYEYIKGNEEILLWVIVILLFLASSIFKSK